MPTKSPDSARPQVRFPMRAMWAVPKPLKATSSQSSSCCSMKAMICSLVAAGISSFGPRQVLQTDQPNASLSTGPSQYSH